MGVFHLKSGLFGEKFKSWDTCKMSNLKGVGNKNNNINKIGMNYLARIRNQRKVLFLNETLPLHVHGSQTCE